MDRGIEKYVLYMRIYTYIHKLAGRCGSLPLLVHDILDLSLLTLKGPEARIVVSYTRSSLYHPVVGARVVRVLRSQGCQVEVELPSRLLLQA